VSVGGNPYALPEELRDAIREKAAEMGADHVFLDSEQDERALVTSEGEPRRLLKRETEPQLTGLVCRSLPVHLGFQVNGRWEVERVFPGSQAETVGIKAGDRIMILNERYDLSDPSAWDRVLSKGRVGESVVLELLDSKGNLQRRTLDLIPTDCVRGKELRVTC
jgi:S1-C subfamily serine protease